MVREQHERTCGAEPAYLGVRRFRIIEFDDVETSQ
jgi:hypothetical protein